MCASTHKKRSTKISLASLLPTARSVDCVNRGVAKEDVEPNEKVQKTVAVT